MCNTEKTLAEKVAKIRKKRGVTPEKFYNMTGITLEYVERLKGGSQLIERITFACTPESLGVLAKITNEIINNSAKEFLSVLKKDELNFSKLTDDAEFCVYFELSSYILFLLDVFSSQYQTHETRLEIFYVVSNELLKALQEIAPEYQESKFNKELYERMNKYGALIRTPDSISSVPPDVSICNLLQENLTNAVVKGGFKKLNYGELIDSIFWEGSTHDKTNNEVMDIVSYVYGITCQRSERNFRLIITELFSTTEDIRSFNTNEMRDIIELAKNKIYKLDKEEINGDNSTF